MPGLFDVLTARLPHYELNTLHGIHRLDDAVDVAK
jgi:hypothetical protein